MLHTNIASLITAPADNPMPLTPNSLDPVLSPTDTFTDTNAPLIPKETLLPSIFLLNSKSFQLLVSMLNFPVAIVPLRPFNIPPPLTK